MSTGSDITALYGQFTDALTEVLAENAGNPARRGRLARARAAVKRHPNYSEHEYFLAVETAFGAGVDETCLHILWQVPIDETRRLRGV
jgi:hypothetical protein